MSDRLSKRKVLRPPGLAVFAVFVLLVALGWWLYADTLVERSVEDTGAYWTGARVDVESADIRPFDGVVSLTGLQVANPDRPMKNLFEADEITADLMLGPLLEKKIVVERLNVLGVRFDTDRETSGALEDPDPEAGQLLRSVNGWADQVEIPELSLESLGGTVRTEAISTDSLATVRYARQVVTRADSMRTSWQGELQELDPRPRIDSLQAVVQRLESFRPSLTNATQIPGLVRDGRAALQNLTSLEDEIRVLDQNVRSGLSSLALNQETLGELRAQDMAYARSLLDIPSLDAPTISPALFGGTALGWMKPVLYCAQRAERFLPPGLDPRRRPGADRVRAEGTTFDFREGAEWPQFLLQEGNLDMLLSGAGPAAGSYTARIQDLTTAPALLGRPLEIALARDEAAQGPGRMSLLAILDHTGEVLRDSADFSIEGFGLPQIPVQGFGGGLDLGQGQASFSASRVGERISARLRWSTDDVSWVSLGPGGEAVTPEAADTTAATAGEVPAPGQPSLEGALQQIRGDVGSPEWARDLVRRTLGGLERVELEMGLSGTLESPELSVSSNLGAAIADALRREVGREVEAAEQRIRAEVNAQIQPLVDEARSRVDEIEAGVAQRVGAQRAEVEELRRRLEERLGELAGEER
ncbi:MAG TPA: hypothetical protein VF150_06080 [Thermoanaerobaculia bacterium]